MHDLMPASATNGLEVASYERSSPHAQGEAEKPSTPANSCPYWVRFGPHNSTVGRENSFDDGIAGSRAADGVSSVRG